MEPDPFCVVFVLTGLGNTQSWRRPHSVKLALLLEEVYKQKIFLWSFRCSNCHGNRVTDYGPAAPPPPQKSQQGNESAVPSVDVALTFSCFPPFTSTPTPLWQRNLESSFIRKVMSAQEKGHKRPDLCTCAIEAVLLLIEHKVDRQSEVKRGPGPVGWGKGCCGISWLLVLLLVTTFFRSPLTPVLSLSLFRDIHF